MHIGIDLDNTVLDATSTHLHCYNQVSGLSLTPEDVDDFYLYRMFGWEEAESEAIYHQHGHDIHWNSTPYPMAAEILRQLFQEHRISFITSRPLRFREVTMAWLNRHNIPYHTLTMTVNKLEACVEANVDVMIDDGPHYAEQFALADRPLILYEQPYNRAVAHNLIYRASNWTDVKRHLDSLAEQFQRSETLRC